MRRRAYLPLLIALAFVTALAPAARAQTINWRSDYNKARKEAQEKNAPLVLDFCMQGCVPCRKLEEITFRYPNNLALITEKFIPLKVEQERDPNLVSALRINGFP